MLTASSIERGKRCPGHTTLPHRDVPSVEADAGHDRHADRESSIGAGIIPEVIEQRWPGLQWRAEVKFAYNLATSTGRILGFGSDRDYSQAGPTEIVGTADCVGIDGDWTEWLKLGDGVALGRAITKLVIVDWKGYKLVPPANVNPQLHIAALALGRVFGVREADVGIHYEVRPFDVAELDGFAVEAFADEVKAILNGAAEQRRLAREGHPVAFNVGSWCDYCPGFYDCPKQKALQADIERHPALVAADKADLPFLDDDDAATAYEFLERAEPLVKRLKTALFARASQRPIPLRNGKVFGPRQTLGNRELDGNKTYELMRQEFGQNIADKAVTRETTQKAIEGALKLAGVKSVAGSKEELLEKLDKLGGIKRKSKVSYDEYDPNEQPKQLKAANE